MSATAPSLPAVVRSFLDGPLGPAHGSRGMVAVSGGPDSSAPSATGALLRSKKSVEEKAMSKIKLSLLVALAAAGASALLVGRASGYEEPTYEVVTEDGVFELRRYDPYVVAETTVEGTSGKASNEAFMRLLRYISGKSRRELRPADREIAMTVPVTMDLRGDAIRMTFMIPGEYTLETAPIPADPAVKLGVEPGGLVAVLSYGGRSNRERFLERRELLTSWAAERGLEPSGEPIFAQYNGPFTPWFLRHNEILLTVERPE